MTNNRDNNMRKIAEIAREIRQVWPKPYFGAVPYLDAMSSLDTAQDSYGCDSAVEVVNYFLANASTFRGEDTRRIKKELKEIVK